jgi:cell shape-determining protein MreC
MSRPSAQSVQARRLLPIAIAILVAMSIAPLSWLGWLRWFSSLVETLAVPASHPFALVSRWVAPARPYRPSDDAVRILEEELEKYKQFYLSQQLENERQQRVLSELRAGAVIVGSEPVRQVAATIIGSSSDLSSSIVRARAGTKHGVVEGAVAVGPGLQLLGRVVSTGVRMCEIQLVTSKASGPMRVRVMVDEAGGQGLDCLLVPQGDGTLRGPIEDRGEATSTKMDVKVGQSVRLADGERWPRSASMFLVGTVELISPDPDQPLRKVVTVRPTLKLDRVGEVILRIEDDGSTLRQPGKGGA